MNASVLNPTEYSRGDGNDAVGAEEFISIVVPVRNEEQHLEATLTRLLEQAYPADRFEIIVSDGESEDATRDIVHRLQQKADNLELVDNPRRLSSGGRNAGIRAARGSLVLIVDGHCQIDDDQLLRNVADAFERSGADCLGRPQPQDVPNATPLQQAIAAARSSWLGHHGASFIYSNREQFVPPQSVAIAYRRHVFDRVGLFDESFDACEDYEFNCRVDAAGLSCFFTPKIAVRYKPRSSLRGLFRQLFRYGQGRVRLLRKHRDTISISSLIPSLFVAGLLLGPLAGWFSFWLATVYAAALVLYGMIVLGTSLGVAIARRRMSVFPWLPLVFFAIHLGAGCGSLAELAGGACRRFVGRSPESGRLSPRADMSPVQRA